MKRSGFRKARSRVTVSVGESVRIMRELQELSQNELAALTHIPQSTLSAIENDRVELGLERAKVIARALRCHPAVLVFPNWDVEGLGRLRPPGPGHGAWRRRSSAWAFR